MIFLIACLFIYRYMSGEETADTVMNRFLANFEQEGVVDGKVREK